jgi:hypothetical protein
MLDRGFSFIPAKDFFLTVGRTFNPNPSESLTRAMRAHADLVPFASDHHPILSITDSSPRNPDSVRIELAGQGWADGMHTAVLIKIR